MKLYDYLQEEGIQHSHFAKRVGISLPTLAMLFKGYDCRLSVAIKIEELTRGAVKIRDLTPTVFRPSRKKPKKEDCQKQTNP